MEPETDRTEIASMRRGYLKRRAEYEAARADLMERARSDAARIIAMIIREYRPLKVYQWGSLVQSDHFSERSDIDIAVEGITDPGVFFEMLGAAAEMTRFAVDLVQIETIHPRYADLIRRFGRLVYEKDA
ncbi:MAG: nucleotidyltransferase domain-containing protein [Spirochaetaceae bacterium]|nr:MAG: nucleotidyltransferase domain-containing protein [Spirochaetaceae bacterium]